VVRAAARSGAGFGAIKALARSATRPRKADEEEEEASAVAIACLGMTGL